MFSLYAFWVLKRAQESPRGTQEAPKSAPRGPKTTPRGPKTAPRAPQEVPRGPRSHPRAPQEAPTLLQDRQKRHLKHLQRCPATEWRASMPKKGGRAAVSPEGEGNNDLFQFCSRTFECILDDIWLSFKVLGRLERSGSRGIHFLTCLCIHD